MKKLFMAALAAAFTFSTMNISAQSYPHSGADKYVRVWDNRTAPHSNEETEAEQINERGHASHTSVAELYVFLADATKATGQAVVVCPGGGYRNVCIMHEGFAVGKWLAANGITAVVLKYRLPNYGHYEVPLEDAEQALRYIHDNARAWGVDTSKIGICGGSAGGHLAAYASNFIKNEYRPAFSILFYPVINGETWRTHMGTFNYLLGKERTAEQTAFYSLDNRVDEQTPPAILLLSDDDKTVPTNSSAAYYSALKAHGVKASMHIYPSGGHGWAGHDDFKYANECKAAILDWLASINK